MASRKTRLSKMPHTDLECPECWKVCRPRRDLKDGGASYRCSNEDKHGNFSKLTFRIDGDGELHY